jgi:hypothetical protein
LGISNPLEAMRDLTSTSSCFDEHDAAVLRTRAAIDKTLRFEHPNLTAHCSGIHAGRTSEISDRNRIPIAERPQNIHGLLGKSDTCGSRHPHMDPPTRQQSAETGESQSDRAELIIDGTRGRGHDGSSSDQARWNAGL